MGRFLGPNSAINIAKAGFFGSSAGAPPVAHQFVAVGSDSSAGSSAVPLLSIRNPVTGIWTAHSVSAAFGANGLFSVAFASGQWLAGTDRGTSGASIIGTSPDAIVWTPQTHPDTGRNLLACGGDAAHANFGGNGQSLEVSATGVTWTDTGVFLPGSFVVAQSAAGGGNYVICGSGSGSANHGYSADGVTWHASTFGTHGGQAVIWDGTQFVTVCTNSSFQQIIATSPTGVTWTPSAALTFTTANFIAFDGVRYVLIGGGSLTQAATATTLAGLVTAVPGAAFAAAPLNAVVGGGGVTVAVGFGDEAYSSPDGVVWTSESTGLPGADQLNAIAYA